MLRSTLTKAVFRLRRALVAGCAGWLGLRVWAALRPTAFPHFGWPILDIPRPLITRRRLLEILDPVAGERMLEVGPGTGYYTLAVAARLEPAGTLEILEIPARKGAVARASAWPALVVAESGRGIGASVN